MSSKAEPVQTLIQFVTNLDYGDAVSDEVIAIDQALRERGYTTAIYCQYFASRLHHFAKVYHDFRLPKERWLAIYHHSIASDLCSFVNRLDCLRLMIYHNVTPPEYFYGTNYVLAELTRKGKADLPSMAPGYAWGLGDSDFNRRDLEIAGFQHTAVLPLIIDFDKYGLDPDPAIMRRLSDGRTNLLFVGRIAPNKRQEDVIKVFHFYKQLDPQARLILAGADIGMEPYRRWLDDLVAQLSLSDVIFTGHIKLDELAAYYRTARVFICLSEHEGFGVPLVESMYFNLPIVALASSAVPETLAGSGVLARRKDYPAIAAAIHQVVQDEMLRQRLIARGRQRLSDFEPQHLIDRLDGYLREMIACE
jgi:glycosyltransferase involved in cell wall biosynthesis